MWHFLPCWNIVLQIQWNNILRYLINYKIHQSCTCVYTKVAKFELKESAEVIFEILSNYKRTWFIAKVRNIFRYLENGTKRDSIWLLVLHFMTFMLLGRINAHLSFLKQPFTNPLLFQTISLHSGPKMINSVCRFIQVPII